MFVLPPPEERGQSQQVRKANRLTKPNAQPRDQIISMTENLPEVVSYIEKDNLPEVELFTEKEVALPAYSDVVSPKPVRRVRGLSRAWVIVLIVGIIVIAVGVVVGVVLAKRNYDSTSETPGTVPTETSATSEMGSYNCPADNGTVYTANIGPGYQFMRVCNADFYGLGLNGQDIINLGSIIAYSMEQCIDACAQNRDSEASGCSAVAYGANISRALDRPAPGNCWLKDQRSEVRVDNSGQAEAAYLVS